jgi:hypothetical protein
MGTSGNHIYNVTANDIITETLGLVGVYAPGETLESAETTDTLRTLNLMLKAWQPKYGLWLNRELSLFLQYDTEKYSIGPTGDHCGASAVKTELAAAASSGAAAITVDAITGFGNTFDRDGIMTADTPAAGGSLTLSGALTTSGIATLSSDRKILIYSDDDDSTVTFAVTGTDSLGAAVTETITGPDTGTVYSTYTYKKVSAITISDAGTGSIEIGQVGDPIGVELDDGTVQWSYIGAAVSTTAITLIDVLTDDAAIDNHVYTYTAETPRVIELIEARLHKANDYEVPLVVSGRNAYVGLPNKTTLGTPNQIYYDKQLDNGTLYTWPVCNDVQEWLVFSGRLPIQNLDALTDDFEVGVEWFEAIAWNLALRLYPKYGRTVDPFVKIQAQEFLEAAKDSDSENTSVFIQIGRR